VTTKKKPVEPEPTRDVWAPEEQTYVAYNDSIELPPQLRLEDVEQLVEHLRGVGDAAWNNRVVTFEVRGFTEWELREVLIEVEAIIEQDAGMFSWQPTYDKVTKHD
jgi:hypothetical protein